MIAYQKEPITKASLLNSHSKGFDFLLFFLVFALVSFGLIMVYSSSFIYAQEKTGSGFTFIKKQVFYAILGFMSLFLNSQIDYRRWKKWAYPVLSLALALLILVFIPGIGQKVGGARRWVQFFGLRFQPGEFAKFAVIFFVARQIEKKAERLKTFTAGIFSHFIIPSPLLFLLLMEPDFGTTVIIVLVIFSLLYIAGVSIRFLMTALIPVMLMGGWLIFGTAYRRARFTSFLDPWSDPAGKGFQILQSLVGLHQGGLWGVGLGNGKEKLFYLPEAHNDFIFSVIGEELGFIGISAIVCIFIFFIYRGLKIAWRSHKNFHDCFGMLLASGITLALGYQAFINISVVMGIVPTKGLTLPFISYGGSALFVDLSVVGVLLNIAKTQAR